MEWHERAQRLRETFTPAAPVTNQDLFSGRGSQLIRLWDAIHAPGEHGAIFGERGVGKTSLARNAEMMALSSGKIGLRVNCAAGDTSADLWRRVESALTKRLQVDQIDGRWTAPHKVAIEKAIEILRVDAATSHEIELALEMLGRAAPVVIFFDEYDRVGDGLVETQLVDVMKGVADQGVPATIVIVGVAADVEALIAEHESIGRGFHEIQMPRMSQDELVEVVRRGLGPAEMKIEDEAAGFIANLSTGLPHYAHLLGLYSGLRAVERAQTDVDLACVIDALEDAVDRAQQHVPRLYFDATHSTRSNMYREVLLSAALTRPDDQGYFAPGDMREPLRLVSGRSFDIPAYANHLAQFAGERGPVLERSGRNRRPRYRFVEPLLIPYVTMRGVREGIITAEDATRLLAERNSA